MRISDWSSDVCSSDLAGEGMQLLVAAGALGVGGDHGDRPPAHDRAGRQLGGGHRLAGPGHADHRSEEHTSELQSLMRISYAVFCLKKKNKRKIRHKAIKKKKLKHDESRTQGHTGRESRDIT